MTIVLSFRSPQNRKNPSVVDSRQIFSRNYFQQIFTIWLNLIEKEGTSLLEPLATPIHALFTTNEKVLPKPKKTDE